jgi:hypothetical protein
LAIALCEGAIDGIGRVWADGEIVSQEDLNIKVYSGSDDQLPDPTMEAIEGVGEVPAYRGTAYVVMENLPLAQFGNRVPQFSFEVLRSEQPDSSEFDTSMSEAVGAVACIPGTGEYTLATTPAYMTSAFDMSSVANINTPSGLTDFQTSLNTLQSELPNCGSVALVVSWFGDDLRCGECKLTPKVEQTHTDSSSIPWSVSGVTRAQAETLTEKDGRPIYGGTPTDASVIEAIHAIQDSGKDVMFYPFILMEQQDGNGLLDPWSAAADQATLPWRGRLTLSKAPGQPGSPDTTQGAQDEVAAFVGTAMPSDFAIGHHQVTYTGPDEWSFRRFVLHYASLCASAGGVEAFCIGSELRGLTEIRGLNNRFVFVEELRALARDVRAILGPNTKISYAADWSEYFGLQPADSSGDLFFHLDPLWADDNIDFIGIDNYAPLSDWRDTPDHLDAPWGSIHNVDYLKSNVQGGEGYDWYYASLQDRADQIRTPIEDLDHNEPWIWRFKDIRNWWGQAHHNRIGGERSDFSTDWIPKSKPIWFTEIGCAAVDKGTNQPNRFVDLNSSESGLPYYSTGARDELIQIQYLRTLYSYWNDPQNNPVSDLYEGPMLDMSKAFVWAWDARPYPYFPNSIDLWSDGENYARGHWINGRTASRPLASVVEEICMRAGLESIDVSGLQGLVRGYTVSDVSDARSALQPLMLRYGFDAVERNGALHFINRSLAEEHTLTADDLAVAPEQDGAVEHIREPEVEMSGRVRLRFIQADADFAAIAEEAILPDDKTHAVAASDVELSMTRAEGRQTVERWLTESRVARESIRFAIPSSKQHIAAGSLVSISGSDTNADDFYRVDRVEQAELQILDAVRVDPNLYRPAPFPEDPISQAAFVPPVPVTSLFLDIPSPAGNETLQAPFVAVTANPWPGAAAVYSSESDAGYALNRMIETRSIMGRTVSDLAATASGIWDRGLPLRVMLSSGSLESMSLSDVLAGQNFAAIGDGTSGNWELFQFASAQLVGHNTWDLSQRLRGRLGTEALMPDVWPAGSKFVLLNTLPNQLDLSQQHRGLERHYRIGPAKRGYDDPSYQHHVEVFQGNALRPYAPCHLVSSIDQSGDLHLRWTRRTRIAGDDWIGNDVPLGEEQELYHIQAKANGVVVREEIVAQPSWAYSSVAQSSDNFVGETALYVAQVSAIYGPGAFAFVQL